MKGYTILDYISIIAKKHGISVMKDIEEKRLQNIFGEQCSVLKMDDEITNGNEL